MTDDANPLAIYMEGKWEPLGEQRLESWDDIRSRLEKPQPGWIFRGVSTPSHGLLSGLHRCLLRLRVPREEWDAAEAMAVRIFRRTVASIADQSVRLPPEDDLLAWLCSMQHYGFPTRLVDWTELPLVAVYFAYEKNYDRDRQIFVAPFMAWRGVLPFDEAELGFDDQPARDEALVPGTPQSSENDRLRNLIRLGLLWPVPLKGYLRTLRMDAQQSLFVCDAGFSNLVTLLESKEGWERLRHEPGKYPHKGWYAAGINLAPFRPSSWMLGRVRLAKEWRADALAYLKAKGIDRQALFPREDPARQLLEDATSSALPEFEEWARGRWGTDAR